ncbi:hypothetical protein BTUL_0102g00270 [Botrytis tulipae]|uniref:Cytochrome P450 n=1 Tax=Botrytis tulipae TaxID=87230 RepID=A0A4Z1ES69_9HELO|nr:hypothetical protein BTUL_0102g00270 [Botrytis tulipae]
MAIVDLTDLASIISDSTSPEELLRFKLPFYELWIARGQDQIQHVLSNPKIFDFEPMKSMVLQRMLDVSKKAISIASQDDSGVSSKAIPNSLITPDKRFNYLERKATHDFGRPSSHTAFVQQFEKNLYQWVSESEITEEWVEFADLYIFVGDIVFQTTTDAFFGPHLLSQNPNLAEDFWSFDESIPFLLSGFPKIFNRQAVKVCARCIQAFRKWRLFALGGQKQACFLPEWNEKSGLKCMGLRNQAFKQFEEWDDNSCAALNSNTVRATFWFLPETMQSEDLSGGANKEVSKAINTAEHLSSFDSKKIINSPLLQSIYAETLRIYVSVLMLRKTRQESKLGTWTVPSNIDVAVCNYTEHMNEKLWNPEGARESHPASTFWGRRFLKYPELKGPGKDHHEKESSEKPSETNQSEPAPVFSTQGLSCRWFPYGSGERMCPGRHFAKHQILLTFAVLSSSFDIELQVVDGWKPKPDLKHFGYGVMPPDTQTPFRIRRRL